jgi:hypothetical protein
MSKIYLYVPFEENAQVKALGGRWDFERKCWYIDQRKDATPFLRWMNGTGATESTDAASADHEYSIVSEQASIARATTDCWKCGASTEVICIYCESGLIDGDPYDAFTVSNITSTDDGLRRQLARWPFFRLGYDRIAGERCLANHCPRCNALQADYYLHCEPDGAFFTLKGPRGAAIKFERLAGRVAMDGDQGFEP